MKMHMFVAMMIVVFSLGCKETGTVSDASVEVVDASVSSVPLAASSVAADAMAQPDTDSGADANACLVQDSDVSDVKK